MQSSFPIPYNLLAWKYHSKPLLQLQWTRNILPTKGLLRPGSPFLSSYSKHRYEGACGIDIILEHESLSMKVKPVYLSMPKMNGKHLGPGYFQASPRLPNMRLSVCEIRKSPISLNLCHFSYWWANTILTDRIEQSRAIS